MRHLAKVAVIASLSLASFTPEAASAQQQTAFAVAPISVKSCSLTAGDIVTPYPSTVRTSNGLSIAFVNTTSVPIASVDFVAKYNGQTEIISDRGAFSPNSEIAHNLNGFYDAIYAGGPATCSVAKVDFADGTSWSAPSSNVATLPMSSR